MTERMVQLSSASDVDQALINENERLVVIRWGRDEDPLCEAVDQIMESVCSKCINMAVFCSVDIEEVPDFNVENKLYDPYTIMFYHKRRLVEINTGVALEAYLDALYPISEGSLVKIVEATFKKLKTSKR
ncbi:hypothetical protein AAMO2058_001582000 [Amorphochlora amoebiformis]